MTVQIKSLNFTFSNQTLIQFFTSALCLLYCWLQNFRICSEKRVPLRLPNYMGNKRTQYKLKKTRPKRKPPTPEKVTSTLVHSKSWGLHFWLHELIFWTLWRKQAHSSAVRKIVCHFHFQVKSDYLTAFDFSFFHYSVHEGIFMG